MLCVNISKLSSLDSEKFEEIKPGLIEHLSKSKFQDDYNKATDAEKQILLRCAKLGKSIFSPSEINSKSQAKLFERLAKKDLLVKLGRGKYSLYHPLFTEYLKGAEID